MTHNNTNNFNMTHNNTFEIKVTPAYQSAVIEILEKLGFIDNDSNKYDSCRGEIFVVGKKHVGYHSRKKNRFWLCTLSIDTPTVHDVQSLVDFNQEITDFSVAQNEPKKVCISDMVVGGVYFAKSTVGGVKDYEFEYIGTAKEPSKKEMHAFRLLNNDGHFHVSVGEITLINEKQNWYFYEA